MTGDESDAVARRYARRGTPDRYALLRPDVWPADQERQRALLRCFARRGWADPSLLDLVEVGCGAGGQLLEFLRIGLQPERITGIELLPDRIALARRRLPAALRLIEGDALEAGLADDSADVVYVGTVFSSLLDAGYRARLAAAIWRWVRPGGGVLWYDFTVDNPRNPDVRGMPRAELRRLFPHARIEARRVTLAPPLARAVCRWHPALYGVLNTLPLLRTHCLAWLEKPDDR